MKKLIALLVITLCSNIYAGQFSVAEFNGLKTTEDALLIPGEFSPDMDNVDISEDGNSFSRRKGQEKLFNLSITTHVGSSFGQIRNDTYDKLLIGYGNKISAIATDYSERVLISTATVGYTWDFVQWLGNTYMTNGFDTPFYTDGYSVYPNTSMPRGSSIAIYNNTFFVANSTDSKGRIYYSYYGSPTNWVTGVGMYDGRSFDVADYGQEVIDLEPLGDSLLVLCSGSIKKLIGDQNPYQIVDVDKSIGCKSKGSVSSYLGVCYFLGSDGQFYKTDGTTVECVSKANVKDMFANSGVSAAESLNTLIDEQSEFEDGVFVNTISTSDYNSNDVILSDMYYGSQISASIYKNTGGSGYDSEYTAGTIPAVLSSAGKSIKFKIYIDVFSVPAGSAYYYIMLMDNGTQVPTYGYPYCNAFRIGKNGWIYYLEGDYDIHGLEQVSLGEWVTLEANFTPSEVYVSINDVEKGSYTINNTYMVNSTTAIATGYYWYHTGAGYAIQCVVHEKALNYVSTSTVKTYISEPIATANNGAWVNFNSVSTSSGGAIAYSLYSSSVTRTSDYLTNTAVWTPHTNDTTPTVSTNSYLYCKSTFTVTAATHTIALNSMKAEWSSSGSLMDMSSTWFEDRLYLGLMLDGGSSTINDCVFVFDPDLDAWWSYKSGVYPSSMCVWKNKFLVASSSFGCVNQMLEGDTDLGNEIDAYYYTKQLSIDDNPSLTSSYDLLTFLTKRQSTGILDVFYYQNGNTDYTGNFTLPMSGGYPIHVDTMRFPSETNSNIMQFKISNRNGEDFTFYGLSGATKEKPLLMQREK